MRASSVAEEFIDEGLERGLRTSVQLVLEGRFGTVDQALLAAIERADKATLEQVLLHVAADSLEELRARLGIG